MTLASILIDAGRAGRRLDARELRKALGISDPELREGLKEYSSWPTYPQLYVDGKLIGGADIVRDLYARGELKKILGA